jgi:hypothetical protein
VPAALHPQKDFVILISVCGRVNIGPIVLLEALGKLKKINDFMGIEPATFL